MAYTYLIGWKSLNTWYYGVRFAPSAQPSDLWKTYFTSSNNVKKFRELHGDPDVIEVRKLFDDPEKARLWESKAIRRMNAVRKRNWLNKTDNTHKFYHEGPRRPFSQEHREKMAAAKRGKKISAEHARKLHEGRKNSKNSIEHIEAIKKHHTGKKHRAESKLKMSIARKQILERLKEVSV